MKNLISGLMKILGLLIQNLKWIVLFGVLIIGTSIATTCAGKKSWSEKYKTYYDSTQALLVHSAQMSDSARKYQQAADSLGRIASRQDSVIRRMLAGYARLKDSAQVANDSLDSLVAHLGPINPVTCQQCLRTNQLLRRTLDTANATITDLQQLTTTQGLQIHNLQVAIHLDTLNINYLTNQLHNLPKPHTDKLFGFITLTPTQTFFIGAGLGSVGTLYLSKH